jgi:hypothetical protein
MQTKSNDISDHSKKEISARAMKRFGQNSYEVTNDNY